MARGPRRPRVSTSRVSNLPSPSAVDPLPDRVALQGQEHVLGPVAAVGEDAAAVMDVLDEDMGGVGRDDELHRSIGRHHARHARRQADIGRIVALPALRLVLHAGLQDGFRLRRQRSLLRRTETLGLVVAGLAGDAGDGDAAPCARPSRDIWSDRRPGHRRQPWRGPPPVRLRRSSCG